MHFLSFKHPADRLLILLVAGGLLTGCAFPRKDFAGMPTPNVIRVSNDTGQLKALPPDCAPLREASQYSTLTDPRPDISFGCATYTNLSQQVARPEDLVSPRSYGNQSADTAAAAVERHRKGEVTPLRATTTTDVGTTQ